MSAFLFYYCITKDDHSHKFTATGVIICDHLQFSCIHIANLLVTWFSCVHIATSCWWLDSAVFILLQVVGDLIQLCSYCYKLLVTWFSCVHIATSCWWLDSAVFILLQVVGDLDKNLTVNLFKALQKATQWSFIPRCSFCWGPLPLFVEPNKH